MIDMPQVGDVWKDVAGRFRVTQIKGDDVTAVLDSGYSVHGRLSWFADNSFAKLVERDGKAVGNE